MPSVRDILRGGSPNDDPDSLRQGVQGGQPLPEEGMENTASMAELMADRLRRAADQRAALALSEINRLQQHIDQMQERIQELRKQNLPVAELHANLEEAENRLEEAQADHARAKESRHNTDLTASLGQGNHEAHTHPEHVGHGTGPGKVRDSLGKTTAAPKAALGPSRRR